MNFPKQRRSRRGFAPAQQPEWQALKAAAWLAHCQREGLPLTLKPDRDWYERELYLSTGHTSTTECNAGRDYDLAMAHFEALAKSGIKWQMKVYSGDVQRMLYSLRAELGDDALRTAKVDEAYLLSAIKKGFASREPWKMDREDLIVILGEVKRHVRRHIKHCVHVRDDYNEARGLWQGEDGQWREPDPEREPF